MTLYRMLCCRTHSENGYINSKFSNVQSNNMSMSQWVQWVLSFYVSIVILYSSNPLIDPAYHSDSLLIPLPILFCYWYSSCWQIGANLGRASCLQQMCKTAVYTIKCMFVIFPGSWQAIQQKSKALLLE